MPSFIQAASGSGNGTAVSPALANLAANVTTGSNILVFIDTWLGGGPVSSVTDPQGNTYTKLATFSASPGGQSNEITVWQASNVTGGWKAVTVNNTTSALTMVTVAEYSSGTLTFDKSVGASSATAGTVTTGNTATTTSATELLLAYGGGQYLGSGGTVTAGSGYTMRSSLVENAIVGTSQGLEEQSVSSTGAYSASLVFTGPNTPINVALFLLTFSNVIVGVETSKTHTIDADVKVDISDTYTIDADVSATVSKTYTIDAYYENQRNKAFNIDATPSIPFSRTYSIDAYNAFLVPPTRTYGIDALVTGSAKDYVRLAGNVLFKIFPNNYVMLKAVMSSPQRSFLKLTATVRARSRLYINLAANVVGKSRSYVRLAGNVQQGAQKTYSIDAVVASAGCAPLPIAPGPAPVVLPATIVQPISSTIGCGNQSYVRLAATIKGTNNRSFLKLTAWVTAVGGSTQVPGNSRFTAADDFLSSQLALASYSPNSVFILSGKSLPAVGIGLIVQSFTAGVQSFQTRTRTWLKRTDNAPNGILVTQSSNVHQLPNGNTITTTTTVTKQKDVTITAITITNSGTPNRITKIVTEKFASGNSTTRETDSTTQNGVINSTTKKTVFTKPPTNDNIQPLQVRTLDGVIHYQFFGPGPINTEWAGGDSEGITSTQTKTSIAPGILNGATVDPFGNPIYKKTTVTIEDDPTGKHLETTVEEVGTRKDIGTVTTDTNELFNGIQTVTTKITKFPDGSQTVAVIKKNAVTGDVVTTTTENVTDEFGQQTTTVTNEEVLTFTDGAGVPRQTTTKTINVTKGGVTTVDTTVTSNNDFEDDIIAQKIKVYGIQEFSITCIIDELNMLALSDINNTHQRSYALLELFGQQLSNGNLSYALRQQLIKQFNGADSNLSPLNLQALGRNYSVVFAQSASGFKAKYIMGTEPHAYELTLILQSRSNIKDGTFGF